MAKGFTVKATAPKPKEQEWDIDAIKERMKGKSIVFCLPGRGCSFIFLKAFVIKIVCCVLALHVVGTFHVKRFTV